MGLAVCAGHLQDNVVGEGGRWKDTARGEARSADGVKAAGDWGMRTMSSAIVGQIQGREGKRREHGGN